MCLVTFNRSDEDLRAVVDYFIAVVQQREQMRGLQFMQCFTKARFPNIRQSAFNQWRDIVSNNLAVLHNTCQTYDELNDALWGLRDNNAVRGVGLSTINTTMQILSTLWDLDMDSNCWSVESDDMVMFCNRNNITAQALVDGVAALDERLGDMTLMDKIIVTNYLVNSNSINLLNEEEE